MKPLRVETPHVLPLRDREGTWRVHITAETSDGRPITPYNRPSGYAVHAARDPDEVCAETTTTTPRDVGRSLGLAREAARELARTLACGSAVVCSGIVTCIEGAPCPLKIKRPDVENKPCMSPRTRVGLSHANDGDGLPKPSRVSTRGLPRVPRASRVCSGLTAFMRSKIDVGPDEFSCTYVRTRLYVGHEDDAIGIGHGGAGERGEANDLRLRLAKEYAVKADNVAVYWDTLAMYVGRTEADRLAAA